MANQLQAKGNNKRQNRKITIRIYRFHFISFLTRSLHTHLIAHLLIKQLYQQNTTGERQRVSGVL